MHLELFGSNGVLRMLYRYNWFGEETVEEEREREREVDGCRYKPESCVNSSAFASLMVQVI